MTQRILGPEGSKRRWRFRYLSLPVLAAVAVALFLAGSAQAVHDLNFQLDGDVIASTVTHVPAAKTQSLDWSSFFSAGGVESPTLPSANAAYAGFTASKFVRDFRANPGCTETATGSFCTQDASTFATGSKDTLDITPGWQCTYSNNVNSKTDLSNVYAAAYTDPATNHKIIYFALERNDNSGDGNVAFWFLQDDVGCTATISGNNVAFTGHHTKGDILVVSSFTNGGTVSTITAYQWNVNVANPNGFLDPNPVAQGVDCKSTTGNDTTCATVNGPTNGPNGGTITTPWLTTNKQDGTGHSLRESEFFEGGLDLTKANLASTCFSSFLGDTRSSQSLTATIFDYAGGSFQHCGANISIAANGVNAVGSPHTFTVHITQSNAGNSTNAPDGTHATVTLTDQNGNAVVATTDTCKATAAGTVNGDCTVTVNSSSAAVITAHASAAVTIQGTTFNVSTNGQGGNSGDAVKRFVDASVSITPSATNEVGHQHVFNISTTAAPSGTAATLTSIGTSVSPAPSSQSTTCNAPTVNGNTATCTLTINSTTAGTFTANATALWHFVDNDANANPASVDVTRTTDSSHGSTGSATKTFEDARVTIASSATNEVGQPHTFTATFSVNRGDGNGFQPESAASCTITLTNSNGASANPAGPFSGSTNASGQFATSFTSATAGQVVGNASCSKTVNTVLLTRDTDPATALIGAGPGGSGPVTKTFVNASIALSPLTATNEVNQHHIVTATVTKNDGSGSSSAAVNAPVVFTVTGNTANLAYFDANADGDNNPLTARTNASGLATLEFTSSTAGTVTINASTTFSVGGVSLTRDTDPATPAIAGPGGTGPASKVFEDARVTIATSATNEVGQPHTFTATFSVNRGDGNGFQLESGANCTITLANSNGAVANPAGPVSGTTNGSGQFAVTFTSATGGVVTGNASCSKTVNTVVLTRDTDPATANIGSGPGGSGPVTKKFVDAFITIGPTPATNSVGEHHTWTITVMQNDGLAAGAPGGDAYNAYGPAPDGTFVTVTTQNQGGANAQLILDGCKSPNGTLGGTCTYTFSSATAGDVIGNASVTFLVGGISVTRATGDGKSSDSGPAIKHFVAGSLSWTKVDNGGQPLGGATFQMCRTHDWDIANNMPFAAALDPPVCVSVTDNDASDTDKSNGHFTVIGLPLGTYTVHETQAPAGYELDPSTKEINVSPANPQAVIGQAFVDSRPVLKITGFGYTNAPEGDAQPGGIFKGATTYTINMHNYGTATAHLTSSSLTVSNNANMTCVPGNVLNLTGTDIAAGGNSGPISVTCHYDHPNPQQIDATLVVKYTTNGLERTASGSPATISYTVNPN
jgi:hypothetical protein